MADPTWLPEVLRAAGLTVDVYPGAMERGHGDFGEIWGVIAHHTGSNDATPASIAEHPTLGLASQLHLDRNGKYTVCGVGIAWHAGAGSFPGIAPDNANQVTIGIEAANDGTSGWPRAQYDAYVRGVAAILNRLGLPSSRVIGHKEWGGRAQGKWDPGLIDMNAFRADVSRDQVDLKAGLRPTPPPVNQIDAEAAVASSWIGRRLHDGERAAADGVGRYADFEHGSIYWHPEIHRANLNAVAVPSSILETWRRHGGERGALGYPVRRHTVVPGVGDVQAFQGGVVYRRFGQAGFPVRGVIGQRWAAEGFETGPLGWPTSDEYDHDGGKRQDFENGTLEWHPSGAVRVRT